MADLLGIDLRSLFASAMGGLLLPVTLTSRTPGTSYDPTDPGAGPRYTEQTISGKGTFSITLTTKAEDGSVRAVAAKGLILLGTMSTLNVPPKVNDLVTFTDPATKQLITGVVDGQVEIDDAGVTAIVTLSC